MTNLSILNNETLTMSSREIAQLTGKEHKHVKRDIDVMCIQLNRPLLDRSEYEHRGNFYKQYHLDKELTLCLVSGYNVQLRMAIIKRWQELESQQVPQVPQTYAEALQLAADQARQLELAAPKVAFVDSLVDRNGLMNAGQIAQKHGKSAIWLNKQLDEFKVYNKAIKRGRVFQQWFVDQGLGQLKQTDQGYSQAMFTNAGEIWVNERLISEGLI